MAGTTTATTTTAPTTTTTTTTTTTNFSCRNLIQELYFNNNKCLIVYINHALLRYYL